MSTRQSLLLNQDQMAELVEVFKTLDSDGNGFIEVGELGPALETCGIKLQGFEIRDLLSQYDNQTKDGKFDINEFSALYSMLKEQRDFGRKFKTHIKKQENMDVHGGMSEQSATGTTHTVKQEEQVAFSKWINRNLADDPDCAKYLPLDPGSRDIYKKSADGILLCKMINQSQSGTIDERAINMNAKHTYHIHENLTLALNSAQSIGCNIVNIGPEDLVQGKPHLVLGLLWQIIRIGLLSDINLHENPNLVVLLNDGESLEDLMKLSPEEILIRWVNYHLARSPCGRQIRNLTGDIKDSVAYIHLLNQIAPREAGLSTQAENEPDDKERAERMLQEADKIGCRSFVSPQDVVNGNYKLNLAFVANLFNSYPALDKPDEDIDWDSLHQETREEKMYRNWMNSMGVSPFVNNLYSDLTNGLIIFQLYDIIKPNVVDWPRVIKNFNKLRIMLEKIENCNYAVELGKQCKFSLVGICGKDMYDGNETLTLALVWQLMRAYTLSVLTSLTSDGSGKAIVEKEIVAWANDKLGGATKATKISSFNDHSISTGVVLIDLVDAIKPGSVNYDLVQAGDTEEERLKNAKYAISMSRKIGARVYALPEDIVEVKSKMVMTVFACLMTRDFQNK